MVLTEKERLVAIIANGIVSFGIYSSRKELAENTNMYDFILQILPKDLKKMTSANLIDEVFEVITSHNRIHNAGVKY